MTSSARMAKILALVALGATAVACAKSGDASSDQDDEAGNSGGLGAGGNQNTAGDNEGGQAGQGEDQSASEDAAEQPNVSQDAADDAIVKAANPFATCIMPLGDSITQADLERMSYRYWLWQQLSTAKHKFGFVGSRKVRHRRAPTQPTVPYADAGFDVDHEGHWGKKPSEILSLLNGVADWNKQTPGIVLLHAGTNEVWSASGESAQAIATRVAGDVEKIITYLRTKNPAVVVLLATVIPLRESNYGGAFQTAIKAINGSLNDLAGRLNTQASPVVIVDQNSDFGDDHFLSDGIHPNEAGERRIAARWYAALRPFLEGAPGQTCPL